MNREQDSRKNGNTFGTGDLVYCAFKSSACIDIISGYEAGKRVGANARFDHCVFWNVQRSRFTLSVFRFLLTILVSFATGILLRGSWTHP